MQALLPTARLHLARGDHDLARAVARRGLQVAGSDRLRAAELLTVLVDAELARGDIAAASAACAELAARIGDVDVPPLRARSDCARSRALVAAGDAPAAVAVLERRPRRARPGPAAPRARRRAAGAGARPRRGR